MPADIMIYGLIAAGLVFWLRSILGTRHSDDPPPRINPFAVQQDKSTTDKAAASSPETFSAAAQPLSSIEDLMKGMERNMAVSGQTAQQGLLAIAQADHSFSPPHFLKGAQDAFVMIVEAFASGDRETLSSLLSPPVYESFCGVLDQRQSAGETASVEIHAIRKAEIIDAHIQKRMAFITVRFTADETSLLHDRDKKLLHGHPDRVTETIDIWTFGRDVRSRDPAWLVYETREGQGDQQNGSTVPGTKTA